VRLADRRLLSRPAAPGYTHSMAQAPALPRGFELPLEPRLPRIGSVDAVALEERAASLAKRSIKRESKLQALELAVRMMDLTTRRRPREAGPPAVRHRERSAPGQEAGSSAQQSWAVPARAACRPI
jgi:deoxyribose-phosphate aldolase